MTASAEAVELAGIAALAAASVKADEIIALDVSEQLVLTDVFVIAAGESERQVDAISDAVTKAMHEAGVPLIRSEGRQEGRWVLLDYNDIVVHVQHVDDRQYYALERLWRDCPIVALPAGVYDPRADDPLQMPLWADEFVDAAD